MNKFNIGDVVKITGYEHGEFVKMTVNKTNLYEVECVWFDRKTKLQRETFNIESLEAV